jgi:hypothetical protein
LGFSEQAMTSSAFVPARRSTRSVVHAAISFLAYRRVGLERVDQLLSG